MDRKRATRLFMLSLVFSGLAPSMFSADDSNPPPTAILGAELSADNFDWRDTVPYLFMAATLPGEQGVEAVLENSSVLRTYVKSEVQAECRRNENPCAAKDDGVTLETEVSKRIDEIVREGFLERHKAAIVDYQLTRRPFPFSEIAAVKSEKHPDAYMILALADRSYTATQLEAKYGDPYDTDIYQWYSIFKYRLDGPGYTSRAVFEIDPVDGAVIKVAISLKVKKAKNRNEP
jgi:hypothetical protein